MQTQAKVTTGHKHAATSAAGSKAQKKIQGEWDQGQANRLEAGTEVHLSFLYKFIL